MGTGRAALVFDADLVGSWVASKADFQWVRGRGTALGLEVGGKLTAGIVYEDWSRTNIVAHFAADVLTPGFMRAIFHYPFVQLGCLRITAPVCSDNHKAIRFVEKLGFKREATLEAAIPNGDLYFYRLWRHECRYLRGYGKEN